MKKSNNAKLKKILRIRGGHWIKCKYSLWIPNLTETENMAISCVENEEVINEWFERKLLIIPSTIMNNSLLHLLSLLEFQYKDIPDASKTETLLTLVVQSVLKGGDLSTWECENSRVQLGN